MCGASPDETWISHGSNTDAYSYHTQGRLLIEFPYYYIGALPWRDPYKDGSVFIDSLCAELVLMKHGSPMEAIRMITRAIRRVAYELEKNAPLEFKQSEHKLPVIVNMLTKELYLSPPEKQTLSSLSNSEHTSQQPEDEVDSQTDGYAV